MHPDIMNSLVTQRHDEIHVVALKAALAKRARARRPNTSRLHRPVINTVAGGRPTPAQVLLGRRVALPYVCEPIWRPSAVPTSFSLRNK